MLNRLAILRLKASAHLDHLSQDLRYTLRSLARSPAFTLAVTLTLGLGIGANAAMFGIIDHLMFRPFPYLHAPAQINRVYLQITSRERTNTRSIFEYTRYLDFQKLTTSFAEYGAYAERPLAVGSGEAAREQMVAAVSASFFAFFDARPALGRFFGPAEDKIPRGANVAVLSHNYWKTQLGGADVLGRPVQVGTVTYTIIGVAPEGFVGIAEQAAPVVFIPVTTFAEAAGENKAATYFTSYNWDWMSVIVRRKPGITEPAATADLTNAFLQSREAQRAANPRVAPASIAHPRAIAGAVKTAAGPDASLEAKTLLWVTGVAAIVLLIACANVTNLMFTRVLRRRRDIATRLALGVSRRRLITQCFMESITLAVLGCAAGALIAEWGGAALRALLLPGVAQGGALTDRRTLGVAFAIALGAGLLTAIGPALLVTRGDIAATLKAGSREGTHQRSRTRSALLILQGALSVILLVGAGLFVRSLLHVRSMPLGYDADPVLMVMPESRGVEMDSAGKVAFRRRLLEAAQAIPGVQYAARINSRPFGTNTTNLSVPGIDSVQRLGRFNFQLGTPDYFKVMGTRIVRGRPFTAADLEHGPPVVVVSEAMGRLLWPGRDPIGQCIRVTFSDTPSPPCITVVGIAENVVQHNMSSDQRLMYYLPLDQVDPSWGNQIFLRVSGPDAAPSAETVRRALSKVMPGQGYVTVQSLGTLVNDQRRSWTLGATMFVAFGVLALLVAAVGLYGVISYNVAQRMHELGVRIALGAQSRDVVRLVTGQGLAFGVAGVAIGLGAALALARWIQPLLFEQSARDPLTYGVVAGLIVLVAGLASAVPALRATRADPNTVLRSE